MSERKPGTNRDGAEFSVLDIMQVWSRGYIDPTRDPTGNNLRRDACGALIRFSDHGNVKSDEGWEIDHIDPVSNGGSDDIDNLQPLQWENNRYKSDKVNETRYCVVTRTR